VNANQAMMQVRTMCRVLEVSPSGYYDWRDRPPSMRAIANAALTERIRSIHADSDCTYGRPRVWMELFEQGERIGGNRIAIGQISPAEFERRTLAAQHQPLSTGHGLPTVGDCVAGATPPVDNPAPVLNQPA